MMPIFEFHTHIHFPSGETAAKLDAILSNQEIIMTTQAEFTAAFERIDTATTVIAGILRDVGNQIGSMSAEEETAAKTRLEAVATSLEAMATTPADPVPVPVPTV